MSSTNGDISLPLIIVNPKSASGATREKWSQTASDVRAHFGPFAAAFTKGPGDGTEIARRAALAGRQFIIACGGDGTINEVANGILDAGTDAELGVLPSGTGGDLRRSLGMPLTNREAAAALRDGETKRMDAGRVTFKDHDGRDTARYFLNVSSVGLAAAVIRRVKSNKAFEWLPGDAVRGKANFALSALAEVLDVEPSIVRVSIDGGEEASLQTIALCMANSRYFGGGMMIAPDARIDDGLLDVVNIGDLSTMRILLSGFSLYRGTHTRLEQVKTKQAARIVIRPAADGDVIPIETDGELPGILPAAYEIVPAALRIRVPRARK